MWSVCNGYCIRIWTLLLVFKSKTRLSLFHIAQIPLGKVYIRLFSFHLEANSSTNCATGLGEGYLWIQSNNRDEWTPPVRQWHYLVAFCGVKVTTSLLSSQELFLTLLPNFSSTNECCHCHLHGLLFLFCFFLGGVFFHFLFSDEV